MTPRAYVLIFFFWSFLAILTPTLVLLSENSKLPPPSFDSSGKDSFVQQIWWSKDLNKPCICWRKISKIDGKNGGINMRRKYDILKVLAEDQQNAPAAIAIPVKAWPPSPSPALAPSPAPAAYFPVVRRFMAGARKVILKEA